MKTQKPNLTPGVYVRLFPEDFEFLNNMVIEEGIFLSALIRKAVTEFVNRKKSGDSKK